MKFTKTTTFHLFAILCVVVMLGILNYTPGTILSGWDNLQTELNPILGIKRAFFSVWQEYQSLGLIAGMAHAADLPRAILVWFLSTILPTNVVRYVLHFLLILVGAFGSYWLLRASELKDSSSHFAFAGSIAYIFSFASLQLLALPFEAFVFFFAFLPWEIGLFLKLLEAKNLNKLYLIVFLILNIIASPQWVAQQLFVVYAICLFILGAYYGVKYKTLWRATSLYFLVLCVNTYWILPQIYFLVSNGSVVWTNKINQLSTGDVLYSNLARGTLQSYIRQEGFFYDRLSINHSYLFEAWKTFRNLPAVSMGIYLSFICALLGIFNKSKFRMGLVLLWLFASIALLANTFPINYLNVIFRSNDFLNQIFRSPFTKFAIPYALVFSYFFAHGLALCSKIVKRWVNSKTIVALLGVIIVLGTSIPAFTGHYLIKDMRVTYPEDYTMVMDYFRQQDPNQRIALMPDYTFWGWFFHTWGYNGSGFLWYGVEQPIISRTFDVWSKESEDYFWQIKSALEAEDIDRVVSTLQKYSVQYIVFDTSLEAVSSNIKALQFDRIHDLLKNSNKFQHELSGEFIHIYKLSSSVPQKSFVSTAPTLPRVKLGNGMTVRDMGYESYGTYRSALQPDVIYPFNGLFSQTRQLGQNWDVRIEDDAIMFTTPLPNNVQNYDVIIPKLEFDESTIFNGLQQSFRGKVEISTDLKTMFVKIPLLAVPIPSIHAATTYPCGTVNDANLSFHTDNEKIVTSATQGAVGCISLPIPAIDQRFGYLFRIKNRITTGRTLFFALTDQTKSQSIIEERLLRNDELFVVPPHYTYGLGYNIHLQTDSYPNIPAENTVYQPEAYFIPYSILSSLRFERKNYIQPTPSINALDSFQVNKKSPYRYEVSLNTYKAGDNLILWQSYATGWVAFIQEDNRPFILGKRLPNHHTINNWANGWTIVPEDRPSNEPLHIIIFFWPQLLQYAGYALLIIALLGVGVFVKKRH